MPETPPEYTYGVRLPNDDVLWANSDGQVHMRHPIGWAHLVQLTNDDGDVIVPPPAEFEAILRENLEALQRRYATLLAEYGAGKLTDDHLVLVVRVTTHHIVPIIGDWNDGTLPGHSYETDVQL